MILYFLISAAVVAADQLLKVWVVGHIALGGAVAFVPHVLGLTYVRNTGASFSLLSDHTWLLTLLSAAASVTVAVLIAKRLFPHRVGMIGLALVLGGAVGNLLDRVRLGYVVDMFETLFMNFAIFNIADMGIVIGGILVMVYLVFWYGKNEEEKP